MAGEEETYFARPGRADYEQLVEQVRRSLEDPCIKVVLEAVSGYVMILNEQRQILAANQELLDALKRDSPDCVVGLRPGEVFNCIHFPEGPDGCGTSEHCRNCGAVLAILASQANLKPASDHCRLSALRDDGLVMLDLQVRATPLAMGGHALTAFVLHDISALKRREVLEHTFLHDFLNTIGGIEGWSRLLGEMDHESAAREILALSASLKEDVLAQRTLLEAERGELKTSNKECDAADILATLRVIFERHPVAQGKALDIIPPPPAARFVTDQPLLMRVVVNMVKNALEATPADGTARVWFEWREQRPGFLVENEGEIAAEVQPLIFRKSFSTRAEAGRGTGTYSMKLYGERFLGGTVSFTSGQGRTQFSIFLPARKAPPAQRPSQIGIESAAGRCVLLIDDEEGVRRLGALFLARLGYSVTSCRSGSEALRLIEGGAFDLVITDMVMPEMSGLEFCERLSRAHPNLPVILCSGFSGNALSEDSMPTSIRGVIAKPFTLKNLSEAIARVLGGA